LSKENVSSVKTNYKASSKNNLVINIDQVEKNIEKKEFCLIDARGEERFKGLVEEPRKNLRRGNVKGSKNLPFSKIINPENNTFKKKEELENIFLNNGINLNEKLAFSCGSGITACVLGLASAVVNNKLPVIYDGSWAEYGLK
jgi:Rhodanese-related sulfurtransferase